MKKLLTATTIAVLGIFSSPAIAQTTSDYSYPRQTQNINPDFRGGTYDTQFEFRQILVFPIVSMVANMMLGNHLI
jgi:hypothetical protein